jgi:predicted  nucleic acid-binding Zn-ribbon protein
MAQPASPEGMAQLAAQSAAAEKASEKKEEHDGLQPQSSFARTTFTTEDVENIKIVAEGVFLLDVRALARAPVVLKDAEGVYYVKLPLEPDGNGRKPPAQKKTDSMEGKEKEGGEI